MKAPHLIVIGGPTASGKTRFAIELAKSFQTEIISADSRQFYRELKIGVARPSEEELAAVPHHFIASHSLLHPLSAGQFAAEAEVRIDQLAEKHKFIVVCGGSGLYIKALLQGFDEMPDINPEIRDSLNEQFQENGLQPLLEELKMVDPDYYNIVDQKNPQRIIRAIEVFRSSGMPFSSYRKQKSPESRYTTSLLVPLISDTQLRQNIGLRTRQMWTQGLRQEAEELFPLAAHTALQTVGYQEVFAAMRGEYAMEEVPNRIESNTWQYARRQKTWFRNQGNFEFVDFDRVSDCHRKVKDSLFR